MLFLGDGDREHASLPQAEPVGETVPPPDGQPPGQADVPREDRSRASERDLELADLHASCPSVRDAVDAGCLAVLDEYFLDRPVYSTLVPAPDAPVWRDVFDDPAAARDGTLRSLAEATCEVANGEIRADLGDVCDVRSMVEQAVLLRECSRNHALVLGYEHLDRELSKIERIVDNTVYWQRRNGIEEGVFRSAWLIEKCSAVPAATTAPLDHLGITADNIYLSDPPKSFYPDRPLDDHEVDPYMWAEAGRLVEMAARLGDGWALSEFRGDAAHVERMFRSNPVQAYIHEVELEVRKVRERYRREHFDGLEAKEDEMQQELESRYPEVVEVRAWQRVMNQALLRGDSAEVRRLQGTEPLAALSSQETDAVMQRFRQYRAEDSAMREEFDSIAGEIRAQMKRDERMVRLTYAIMVKAEAERLGLDVDVMPLYQRAAPFSQDDVGTATERANAILAARRAQRGGEEQ